MSNTETASDKLSEAEGMDVQIPKELEEIINNKDFHGFCSHTHNNEAGILWNDAGHRLQIERAVCILTAVEPAGEFLSLWSRDDFRNGFYTGLWQADYREPYNNILDLTVYKKAIYTSHFFNPVSKTHIGNHNEYLSSMPRRITGWKENAWTMVEKLHYEAAKLHDEWKDNSSDSKLREMGRLLGLASHYFTDLTQPMHAANFGNGLGFEGSGGDPFDFRHQSFENVADDIINDLTSNDKLKLLCNPAEVDVVFADNLEKIVFDTALNAKSIFDSKVKDIVNKIPRNRWYNGPIYREEAMPALELAFPSGQIATARFFQQWVRQSHDQNPSRRFRSDWVSVSVRRDSKGVLQPCMFYRQDDNLQVIFKFFDNGNWNEDKSTFAEFAGGKTNSAAAFAASYDKGTDHPSLFIANDEGRLFYFDITGGKWTKKEIILTNQERVRGYLVSTYDEMYNKPSAFYRGQNGCLYYIYWSNNDFKVGSFKDFPKVGGAISAVWDPQPSGFGDKGHVAISYVGGDGVIYHLNVREQNWKITAIPSTQSGTHASSQMVASVYDAQESKVGVFWGMVQYEKKTVPESDPPLTMSEQQPAVLMYTTIGAAASTTSLGVKAAGGIGAVSKPNVAVIFGSAGFSLNSQLSVERLENVWTRYIFKTNSVGMIAAINSNDGNVIIGSRLLDRSSNISSYKANITFKTGDIIALQADNGKYLGRINYGERNMIEAVKVDIDHYAKLKVIVLENGKIALQSDAGENKCLNRDGANQIEAGRDNIDESAKFKVVILNNGKVALQADNGFYFNCGEAGKIFAKTNNIADYSLFTVLFL
jgi:hypothetical protein